MPAATGAFSEFIEPGLRAVFDTDLKLAPSQSEMLFNVEGSTHHSEYDNTLGGMDTMPELAEGANVTYDDPTQGYKTTYTHVQYGLAFAVTRIMWADDLYKVMAKKSKWLARSGVKAFEASCADVFNNGFSGSYLGADGKALFATDHPLLNGSSDANEPSTPADLSKTALQAAVTEFRGFQDDTGAKVSISPRYLLVPAAEQFNAEILVGSTLDPTSAMNAINPMHNRLTVVVYDWLTDDDAWFLLADKAEHQLNLFWRERPSFEASDDFDTGNALFKSYQRFIAGWTDWRGVYGSPGA